MRLFLVLFFLFAHSAHAFTLITQDPEQEGWASDKVTFRINRANCPANINDLLQAAVKVWNGVPWSRLKVEIGEDSSTTIAALASGVAPDAPLIVCDTNFSVTTGSDENSVAGIGFVSGGTRPLIYGGVVLNVQAGGSANLNNLSSDLASVIIAHEIGHVLGIGHSEDKAALMYFDGSYKKTLSLAQDDVQAILYLYPRDEWSGKQIGGCGTIGFSGNWIWLLLAPILLGFGLLVKSRKLAFEN